MLTNQPINKNKDIQLLYYNRILPGIWLNVITQSYSPERRLFSYLISCEEDLHLCESLKEIRAIV